MSRLLILLYGIVSYFVGVAGLACIILALAKLIPFGFLTDSSGGMNPIAWNVILVAIWGLIHSGMARPGFKAKITKIIPEPAERATYVLVSGLTSIALIGYWKIVPGDVWNIGSTPLVYALWGLFMFGWVFLLAASFAINHFDLFGLRQVYLNFKSMDRPPLNFVKRAMYKYIRHPIQTGVLIGVWATPYMTMTQLVLSVGFTVYIFVGLWFEEKDLIAEHGDSYLQYKNETGSVFPKFTK